MENYNTIVELDVRIVNPLKQGLKLHYHFFIFKFELGKNSESIKTRIETNSKIPLKDLSSKVRIVNPLKQGLKHFSIVFSRLLFLL